MTIPTKRAPFYLALPEGSDRSFEGDSRLHTAYTTLAYAVQDAADLAHRMERSPHGFATDYAVLIMKAKWIKTDRCDERICKVSP